MAFDNWGNASGVIVLTEAEKAVRRSFVAEYLKDYDAIAACIRIGYEINFAKSYAVHLMQDAFTLNLILEEQRRKRTKEEEASERYEIMRLTVTSLKELAQRGGDRARVGACKLLTQLYSLEDELKLNSAVASGVMVVPGVADVTDWEKTAMESQTKLMKDSN